MTGYSYEFVWVELMDDCAGTDWWMRTLSEEMTTCHYMTTGNIIDKVVTLHPVHSQAGTEVDLVLIQCQNGQ